MSCCREKPEVVSASEATPPFDGMECLKVYSAHFASLRRCGVCGQLWVVDAWDKYMPLTAFKVDDAPCEEDIEGLVCLAHDRLAEQGVGGLSDEKCVWFECGRRSLRGMKVCRRHAGGI